MVVAFFSPSLCCLFSSLLLILCFFVFDSLICFAYTLNMLRSVFWCVPTENWEILKRIMQTKDWYLYESWDQTLFLTNYLPYLELVSHHVHTVFHQPEKTREKAENPDPPVSKEAHNFHPYRVLLGWGYLGTLSQSSSYFPHTKAFANQCRGFTIK